MEKLTWKPVSWTTYDPPLFAIAEDGARVELHLDDRDGEVRPSFIVHTEHDYFSTDCAEDWPCIEKYVPREQWPSQMYAGGDGPLPSERTPDPAVADAVRQYQVILDEAAAGDE